MKKIITSILVIMSVIHGVKSQYLNTKSVKSPNVTSMERFNDIPINLFTGTPDISIPIQQIESGNIKIPIELRYHASSVKPNQPPSWVGLGWDLNCGGNISREVRGHYDEYVCPSSGSYACFTGYLAGGANILYNDPNWNNPNNIYYYNLGNIYSDQQADEFSFNFLGHSGKFYYAGSANGWVVISDEKIKVEVNGLFTPQECINNALYKYVTSANHTWMTDYYSSNQSVFFKEFTITTPDGSKYTFGGIDAVEFTTQYSGSGTCYNGIDLSSWLLKKIEDVNGKIINYNYVRNYPSLYLSHYCNTYSQSFTSNSCNPPEIVGSGVTGSQNGSFSTSQLMNSYRLAGRLVFPMYLKTIDTEIETVTFSSSPATTLFYTPTQLNSVDPPHQWDDANEQYGSSAPGAMSPYPIQPGWFPNLKTNKLTNIDIKSKATNTDVYKFTFEYFENSNQRFALSKFNMLGSDSSIQKKYEFKYDNIADLPLFGGNYIDHWGFYNNKNIGSALSGAFSNRETNPLYVTKGLLTEIKYPTGGTTSFIWEAHRHSRVLSDSKNQLNPYIGFAGGSRIKEIKSYTDVGILSSHKKYYRVTY
ncbi:hypothetical protein B0A58_15515, partial [Flavobacterium branchiophilum NBRC 15030 = ATCC 35035]